MKPSPNSAKAQLLPHAGNLEDRSAAPGAVKRNFSPVRAVKSLYGEFKRSKASASQETSSSPSSSSTAVHGNRLSQCLQRVIRLAFPASTAQPQVMQFPHEVSRLMQKTTETEASSGWSVMDLLSDLKESMEQKQGFVMLRDASEPSLGLQFQKALGQTGGAIRLDAHCTLRAIQGPLNKSQHSGVTQWHAMVLDDRLGFEVAVPLTEWEVPNVDAATRSDLQLHSKLLLGKQLMDVHLEEIHSAFVDSPHHPPIICPRNPRLALLMTAQEECLSRYYRGLHSSNDRLDWLCFMESVLGEPQFGQSAYRGEEGCAVEAFFTHLPKVERRQLPAFSVGGHAGLAPNQDNYSDYVRAYKRHLPSQVQPPRESEIQPQRHSQAQSITQSSLQPARPMPVAHTHSASSSSSSAVAGPSQASVWRQRANRLAYKEASRQMQCGLNAYNSLMQGPALSAEELMSIVVQRHAQVGALLGVTPLQAKGLMHPQLLEQLTQHGQATVSKSMFGAGLDPVLEQSHAEQWKALVNTTPQAQGKNWVDDGATLRAIDRIEVSADQWLSAHRGLDMEGLTQLVNDRLAHTPQNNLGMQLPAHYALTPLTPQTVAEFAQQQSQRAAAWLSAGTPESPRDYPMVVRCAGTGQDAGHYYTVVPDGQGNWLSLNGDGTSHDGQQTCRIWAAKGALPMAMVANRVQQVLHPQL